MAKPHQHQHQQQPQPHPYPHPHGRGSSGRTNLASCVVASIFLAFLVIVAFIVYFTVFKPKDPKISVTAVQLPSFSLSNGSANFTISQYVAVRNPNRASFTHYDSSFQLLYSGSQVGFLFIPAGKIDSGRTQFMAATFAVQSFPVLADDRSYGVGMGMGTGMGMGATDPGMGGLGPQTRLGPTMEIESRIEMAGRVRVLHFFTHRVVAKAECKVAIAVSDGSVLGFHC